MGNDARQELLSLPSHHSLPTFTPSWYDWLPAPAFGVLGGICISQWVHTQGGGENAGFGTRWAVIHFYSIYTHCFSRLKPSHVRPGQYCRGSCGTSRVACNAWHTSEPRAQHASGSSSGPFTLFCSLFLFLFPSVNNTESGTIGPRLSISPSSTSHLGLPGGTPDFPCFMI